MKIDMSAKFTSIDGRPMLRPVHEYDARGNVTGLKDMVPMTMADALLMVLGAASPSAVMSHEEAIRRRKLADRIIDAKEPVELGQGDIDRLKACLTDTTMLHPLVLSDVRKTLDPEEWAAV